MKQYAVEFDETICKRLAHVSDLTGQSIHAIDEAEQKGLLQNHICD